MSSGSNINDYIAGALGGAAGLVVGHPFDTTKVQLQTRQTGSPYKGIWDAVRSINQAGMSRGFFRGLGFPLVSYGVVNSVFFGVYGHTLTALTGAPRCGDLSQSAKGRPPTYPEVFLAGCVGGFFQLFVACPVDVVKIVLQSQIPKATAASVKDAPVESRYFRGAPECISWIYRTHGVRGFYHGAGVMALRDVPTFGLYMLVYRGLMDGIPRQPHIMVTLVAGGVAGVVCWTAAMPFDVVKSIVQSDLDQQGRGSRGLWDSARGLYRKTGIRGFFTGLGVTCFRAFPTNAVTFIVYQEVLDRLT